MEVKVGDVTEGILMLTVLEMFVLSYMQCCPNWAGRITLYGELKMICHGILRSGKLFPDLFTRMFFMWFCVWNGLHFYWIFSVVRSENSEMWIAEISGQSSHNATLSWKLWNLRDPDSSVWLSTTVHFPSVHNSQGVQAEAMNQELNVVSHMSGRNPTTWANICSLHGVC